MYDVVAGLADDINANAAPGYIASVMDNILVVTNINGTAFTVTVISPADCTATIAATATTKTIMLTGTAAESEQWSIGLTQDGQTISYRFYVDKAGTTLHDVAVGLIVALNESTGAEFVAGVRGDGNTLVLTNLDGASLAVSLTITPRGRSMPRSTAAAGESAGTGPISRMPASSPLPTPRPRQTGPSLAPIRMTMSD